METQKLTRAEALAKGYTMVGEPDIEWQCPRDIDDLSDQELLDETWLLFDVESSHLSVSPETIKDAILDDVSNSECEINCDTCMGIEALEGFDWSELYAVIEKVNKELESASYRMLTQIQLIP